MVLTGALGLGWSGGNVPGASPQLEEAQDDDEEESLGKHANQQARPGGDRGGLGVAVDQRTEEALHQ
jgi:hypothetical protein